VEEEGVGCMRHGSFSVVIGGSGIIIYLRLSKLKTSWSTHQINSDFNLGHRD
jgi:hypothetical protein